MDNFIDYLDNYKTNKSIDYNDICNIINTTQSHFNQNKLYDIQFTGIPYYNNYSKTIWDYSNKPPRLPNKYELWKQEHESLISTSKMNKKKKYIYINVSVEK